MGFNKKYRSLFNVEMLHHYFLDEANVKYGFTPVVTEEEKKVAERIEGNLANYQLSNFVSVQPTTDTVRKLKNARARFAQTKRGFQVIIAEGENNKPFIPFSANAVFDFIVTLKDPLFENYTDITIKRSEPLFLSNRTPADSTEDTASSIRFCLLSKFKTSLTNGNSPTAPMEQKDIEIDGIESRELVGAFAIIRIHLTGEANEITLTNGGEEFNAILPKVNWIFENRSTVWKYHQSSDSAQVHETLELPLTKHGYVSVLNGNKRYPNPSAKMIYEAENGRYVDLNGDPVVENGTKKYSRIFI